MISRNTIMCNAVIMHLQNKIEWWYADILIYLYFQKASRGWCEKMVDVADDTT